MNETVFSSVYHIKIHGVGGNFDCLVEGVHLDRMCSLAQRGMTVE